MAEGDGFIYNNFKERIFYGDFNLGAAGDTIQCTLHTAYTPNIDAAHSVWLDTGVSTTEYGTASGYTAGGKVLANQVVAQDDTNDRGSWDADNVTWTSLGALSPATPSDAIIWDNTLTSPQIDTLICYFELGATATNGGDYTLAFGANGIMLLT
jgi:hypothetical protein